MNPEILLVGSMPYDTVDDVYSGTASLAPYLNAIPDGETGARRFWTPYLPSRTFSGHPDLIEVSRPGWAEFLEEGHDERATDGDVNEHWPFKIKPGVTSLDFGSLHYAEPSLVSYRRLKAAQDRGDLPADLKFQVGIPSTDSVVEDYFPEREDWPLAKKAYQQAAFREIEQMLEEIPADKLVVQWDLAVEPVNLELDINPWRSETAEHPSEAETETRDEIYARHMRSINELWKGVPEPVELAYHWCYGTWGGWPMTEMTSLSLCVDLSNDVVANSGRPVQYVHMPVMPDADEAFFEPLKDLDIGDTKVYLGIIHHDDSDPNGFERRFELARRFLPDFGIAGVCGYGRLPKSAAKNIVASHEQSAALVQAAN
ncbi:MAG TPA: hypothetical protein VNT22_09860 [Baekduia sp.]|nr:hypothetical protein [Baekduia sp.]